MTTIEKSLQNEKLTKSIQELRKKLITLINESYNEKNEYCINYNERLFHFFESIRNSIVWEVDRRIKELEDDNLSN